MDTNFLYMHIVPFLEIENYFDSHTMAFHSRLNSPVSINIRQL
jgi:hypothetical protein